MNQVLDRIELLRYSFSRYHSRVQVKQYPKQIKEKARKLREKGLGIGEISHKLKVPKSTLHYWISDLRRPQSVTRKERLELLKRIRPLASQVLKRQRKDRLIKIRKNVIRELTTYPLKDKDFLKSMLAMLYWSEGSKSRGSVQFANTDPRLSLLFITLLRKCYPLDEEKIRIRLHLHYYHKIRETRKFWSSLLNVHESKFGKIYIKKRGKTKRFRQNFAGICFIRYHSEDLRYEILERAYLLGERITGQVPVA